ncbi:hypothetical protein LguiA_002175 [Lonicera macranthoides]
MSHCNSHVRDAMARYSAFAKDQEIVYYFLDFHEMGEVPRKMQYLVVEQRVSG